MVVVDPPARTVILTVGSRSLVVVWVDPRGMMLIWFVFWGG